VRIDRFLFFVRLAKSRTLAQGIIAEGRIRIDGRRVLKSSEEIRAGSVIALPLNGEVRVIRVLSLPVRRGPAEEAGAHYEEIAANVSQQFGDD
jgi:ribosome-associated heat shock protein Hsp15